MKKGSQRMLSHTRIRSIAQVERSRFALLGTLAVGAGVVLAMAAGCSSSPSPVPGASTSPGVSTAPGASTCGNGVVEVGEDCDGNVGSVTCGTLTMGDAPHV